MAAVDLVAVEAEARSDMASRPRCREHAVVAAEQRLARIEIGGMPASAPAAYAARGPIHYVHRLAGSGVPLHIRWSVRDRIVVDQQQESGRLYRAIVAANPEAPVTSYVGAWAHTAEMQATARLPLALVKLKLVKLDKPPPPSARP